jgi:DNA polymerase
MAGATVSTSVPASAGAAGALARTFASVLAGAAETLDALAAAVAGFEHPLRRPGEAPQPFSGAMTSGIIIIADQPEPPGSDSERLRGRMLAAIGLNSGNHGILNLLPWPTLDNGAPREQQVADFAPFVARVLALAQPALLLALGSVAASLAGPVRGIASARGRWRGVGGVPLLITYHPRSLIAQPAQKSLAWADLQAFAERMPGKPQ